MNIEHPIITQMERYGELTTPKIDCYCDRCAMPIYEGDDYYDFIEEFLCERCVSSYRKTAGED